MIVDRIQQAESAAMRLARQLDSAYPGGPSVIALGKFDGVHIGHRALVNEAVRQAGRLEARPGALTFDPLPFVVFNPGKPFHYLCTPAERVQLLRSAGAQFVPTIEFTDEFSLLTAGEFMHVVHERLNLVALVIGPDVGIGHKREGNVARLRELGGQLGFEIVEVPPVMVDGQPVSSSQIRKHVYAGEASAAARGLGRYYSITGTVVAGDRRGRELGFPTANLNEPEHIVMPADGIYACFVEVAGKRWQSAVNIGVRPTFGEGLRRLIEAYIFDFSQDIYGESMRIEFVERLRGETRFDGVEALKEQIRSDVVNARDRLARE